MEKTTLLTPSQYQCLESSMKTLLAKQGFFGPFTYELRDTGVKAIQQISKISFEVPFAFLGKEVQKLQRYQKRIQEKSHAEEGSDRIQYLTDYAKKTQASLEDISHLAINLQMPFGGKKNRFSFGKGIRSLTGLNEVEEASRLEDYIRSKGAYLDVAGNFLTYTSYLALTAGNFMKIISSNLAKSSAEKLVQIGGGISAGASLVLMGSSAFKFYHTYKFRSLMQEYLNNSNLTEQEQYVATLRLIKEQVYITEEEKQKILKRLQGKGLSLTSVEGQQKYSETLSMLSQKKLYSFIEKTGRASFTETISKVDYLLQKLQDKDPSSLEEAKAFIEGIFKANQQRLNHQGILFLSFFLGFIASVLSLLTVPIPSYWITFLNLISITIYLVGAIINILSRRREQDLVILAWKPFTVFQEKERLEKEIHKLAHSVFSSSLKTPQEFTKIRGRLEKLISQLTQIEESIASLVPSANGS